MDRKIFMTASLFGGISVVLGAFAAHGLKPLLSVSAFDSFNTGIRYQMYQHFCYFLLELPRRSHQNKNRFYLNSSSLELCCFQDLFIFYLPMR